MNILKKIGFVALMLLTACHSYADSLYSFVTDKDGYSWIQINYDMDSFSFKLTNTGLDKYQQGDLRYFTFTGDVSPSESAWKNVGGINYGDKVKEGYIEYGIIDKMNETVTIKNLKSGTRIGFQMVDTLEYHNEFNWNFQGLDDNLEGTVWFGSYAAKKDDKGILNAVKGFFTYGAHHNDWVTLGSFMVNGHCAACFENDWETYIKLYGNNEGGNDTPMTGAPLPGFLAMLMFGGVGAGFLKIRKNKKN